MAWVTNPGDEEMITDLHMELCVPETKGGQEFWTATAEDSVCAQGNYETTIRFHREQVPSVDGMDKFWLMITQGMDYGNAGMLDQRQEAWTERFASYGGYTLIRDSTESTFFAEAYAGYEGGNSWAEKVFEGTASEIPLYADVVVALKKRCKALGDCAAEVNWLGYDSGDTSVYGDGFIDVQSEEEIEEFNVACEVISTTNVDCVAQMVYLVQNIDAKQ
jgi:hypothetical protein